MPELTEVEGYRDLAEATIGPDVTEVGLSALRDLLAGSVAPLKYRLMDQRRIGGIGNLMADELLWRAGLRPTRPVRRADGRRAAAAASGD